MRVIGAVCIALLLSAVLFAEVAGVEDGPAPLLKPEEIGVPASISAELSQSGSLLAYKVSIADKAGSDATGVVRIIVKKDGNLFYAGDRVDVSGSLEGTYPISSSGAYEILALEDTKMLSANASVQASITPVEDVGANAAAEQEKNAKMPDALGGLNVIVLTILVLAALIIAYMMWKRRRRKRG